MKRLMVVALGITVLNLMGVIGARSLHIADEGTNFPDTFSGVLRQNSKIVDGVWCWLDICPGYTSLVDARTALLRLSFKLVKDYPNELQVEAEDGTYTFVAGARGRPGFIDTIVIEPGPQAMTLGESILQFGTPVAIQEEAEIGDSWHRAICLQFGACVMVHGLGQRVQMDAAVNTISYHSSNAQTYTYGYRPWMGFALIPSSWTQGPQFVNGKPSPFSP